MGSPANSLSAPRRSAAVVLMRLAAGASGLSDALLRPREVRLLDESGGAETEALVGRVVAVGSELRAELTLADGSNLWTRISREQAEQLELGEGQILAVSLAPTRASDGPLARAA